MTGGMTLWSCLKVVVGFLTSYFSSLFFMPSLRIAGAGGVTLVTLLLGGGTIVTLGGVGIFLGGPLADLLTGGGVS